MDTNKLTQDGRNVALAARARCAIANRETPPPSSAGSPEPAGVAHGCHAPCDPTDDHYGTTGPRLNVRGAWHVHDVALLDDPVSDSPRTVTIRNGIVTADADRLPGASRLQDPLSGLFRPVQFLGAKTRVLAALLQAAEAEIPDGTRVLDLFSGSSLVAQGFGRLGHPVAAFDALEQCAHYARALLGVGRSGQQEPADADSLVERGDGPWARAWSPWLEQERSAVETGDPDKLIALAQALPQVWRPTGASSDLNERFAELVPGACAHGGLVSAHYAGTYFGLEQALEIDRLRAAIAVTRSAGGLTAWEESVHLTALLSAASECAFSAGKHYAQPHRIRPGKDLTFIRDRIVADRSKPLRELFLQRLEAVTRASLHGEEHQVAKATMEELLVRPLSLGTPTAIYADPPYAAQQYSRFYHVPEVICAYRVPRLQRVRGLVTRGLYPEDRHKSRFCSRRQAPAAFADLCRLAVDNHATLLLSYSYSRTGETGNRRSIELPALRAVLRRYFTSISERDIAMTYRQFNSAASSMTGRSDAELLIVAKNRA